MRFTRRVLYVRAAVGLVFPVFVDVIVPAALVRDDAGRISVGDVRFVALPLVAFGCWLLLDSVFMRFAREGRGTLVPVDPPRFVVQGGAYRVVRTPMYVANVAIITGSAFVFRSWYLLVWAGVVFVVFSLFVILYEEPTLRRQFGDEYESYRREVGRWLPRLRRGSFKGG